MTDLFATIGNKPVFNAESTPVDNAREAAQYTAQAASQKAIVVANKLAETSQQVETHLAIADAQTSALTTGQADFNLMDIITGWFDVKQVANARQLIAAKASFRLSIDAAAVFGTIPDAIVRQFVNSAYTKATGDAKLAVARVLDEATGAANGIKTDGDVNAQHIEAEAQKIIRQWKNLKIAAALFENLHTKVLNRVESHQRRLEDIMQDLAKNTVLLDGVSASLMARMDMVMTNLFDTCVNGLILKNIIATEQQELQRLEAELAALPDAVMAPHRLARLAAQR